MTGGEETMSSVCIHIRNVSEAFGLFPSVIKSGEDWSPTCQQVLERARASLTALGAAALASTTAPETPDV